MSPDVFFPLMLGSIGAVALGIALWRMVVEPLASDGIPRLLEFYSASSRAERAHKRRVSKAAAAYIRAGMLPSHAQQQAYKDAERESLELVALLKEDEPAPAPVRTPSLEFRSRTVGIPHRYNST